MQKEEYLIKNACYSVTKYYLCKQNNKRSLLGRKQRNQVTRSFPNRYLFSYTNKVTSLFSISCILRIILSCKKERLPLDAPSAFSLTSNLAGSNSTRFIRQQRAIRSIALKTFAKRRQKKQCESTNFTSFFLFYSAALS